MNNYYEAERYDKERGEWIIERPRVRGIRLSHRDSVKLWRAQAAYDLACITGTPHESRVAACASLLDRVTRYSLALERQAENDNDADIYRTEWKRRKHEHNAELLEKRGEKLEKELQEYAPSCKLRSGVYAHIEDPNTHNDIVSLYYY